MTKEDILLPVEMGKLEIEPVKVNISKSVENPFIISQEKRKIFTHKMLRYSKCTCVAQKRDITIPIYKRKNNRLLKEPTLKLLQVCNDGISVANLTTVRNRCTQSVNRGLLECVNHQRVDSNNLSLHSLVDNCNQLRISSESNVPNIAPAEVMSEARWWKTAPQVQSKETGTDKRAGPSCSQEALNPPCDVTIDELASYFETLVHIPKKMSSMAEMMYI